MNSHQIMGMFYRPKLFSSMLHFRKTEYDFTFILSVNEIKSGSRNQMKNSRNFLLFLILRKILAEVPFKRSDTEPDPGQFFIRISGSVSKLYYPKHWFIENCSYKSSILCCLCTCRLHRRIPCNSFSPAQF